MSLAPLDPLYNGWVSLPSDNSVKELYMRLEMRRRTRTVMWPATLIRLLAYGETRVEKTCSTLQENDGQKIPKKHVPIIKPILGKNSKCQGKSLLQILALLVRIIELWRRWPNPLVSTQMSAFVYMMRQGNGIGFVSHSMNLKCIYLCDAEFDAVSILFGFIDGNSSRRSHGVSHARSFF
jgi:hypothetical protein